MAFVSVSATSMAALALTILVERGLQPRLMLSVPVASWALHVGSVLCAHAVLVLVLGRPLFAGAAVVAFWLMLVLVNNAKFTVLREPFIVQDFSYFKDAIRHPRLYIPFLGWLKFLAAATAFGAAAATGWWGETPPAERFALSGQWGGVLLVSCAGLLCIGAGLRVAQVIRCDPVHDFQSLGFLGSMWRYAQALRRPLTTTSRFDRQHQGPWSEELPHLVAVQSESFFDPRSLFAGIRPDVLAAFDAVQAESVLHGQLNVPAWGANTVRTEFAFLTGVEPRSMGVHQFNPYGAVAAGARVASLAAYLKQLGYRTIGVHPYPASFYQRDRVFPQIGFDEFLDIRAFADVLRSGPYISDAAVADKVSALVEKAQQPTFIFVVTMENHGPLSMESPEPGDVASFYASGAPSHCEDLTVYLRHLKNADDMIARLRRSLMKCSRPASLCWYGDHVPIMASVFDRLGSPDGTTPFMIWRSDQRPSATTRSDHACAHASAVPPLDAWELGVHWLHQMGLWQAKDASNRALVCCESGSLQDEHHDTTHAHQPLS